MGRLNNVHAETHRRFDRVQHRSQRRMGATETTHDEMLTMLLDAWELFERDYPVPEVVGATRVRSDGGESLTQADAWDAAVEVLIELADDDPDYQRINEAGKAILSDARQQMDLSDGDADE